MPLLTHACMSTMLYFILTLFMVVAYGDLPDENLNNIEILQKKCLRIVTFSDFNSHTNPLFIDIKLLKVSDIMKPSS